MTTEDMKKALRSEYRSKRSALNRERLISGSTAICKALKTIIDEKKVHSLMAYLSMPDEPNLRELIDYAFSKDIVVYVPRCTDTFGIMKAHRLLNWNELERGAFGIQEPNADSPTASPEDIDCILVPGILFDENGGRMGMGGGYYDRFLASISKDKTIGICWEFQVREDKVPMDKYDITVGMIVTEKRVR